MTEILVVGANGRVGRAVLPVLESLGVRARVAPRDMIDHATSGDGAYGALVDLAKGTKAIVNLAGRAHLRRGADVTSLNRSNVELPLRLLEVATNAGVPLVHLSSSKAGEDDDKATPYALSKAIAEQKLAGAAGRPGSVAVVTFRTCAVMAPPYDEGKLSLLKRLRWMPTAFVPVRRVPVIAPEELAALLKQAIDLEPSTPFTVLEVPRASWMTLREVIRRLRSQT